MAEDSVEEKSENTTLKDEGKQPVSQGRREAI